jgi:hypothetical protein
MAIFCPLIAAMMPSWNAAIFLKKPRTAPEFLGELAQDGQRAHAMVERLESRNRELPS